MLNIIGPHYDRQGPFGDNYEGGFGNETVVDRVPEDMRHLIDPSW